jgi:hypothetical protein
MADTYGEVQIVATSGRIICDVLSRNYDTTGRLHKDHALISLPLPAAMRLHRLLADAIVAAEGASPNQASLWSNATTQAVAGEGRRRLSR